MHIIKRIASSLVVFGAVGRRNLKEKVALLGLLLAAPAIAGTDNNLTLTGVGSQSGNIAYIFVSPGTSGGCSIIYIDITNDAGRGMLSIALTARASGRPIARVDYTGGGGGPCNATLIQL
ncbi:hypothetical protein SAMN05444678_12621 [Sphingomonas sp. YR710]|uniref:hypothetical protein n=1 Tax=Sphingomonas sp. YR710 TaxID=1882773 RepID=UPI0008885C92|nr:hypothetical protein [Sphingomonas sp. YR710]SDD85191.1 hypothetical protein SAMN05444678_12621 [Sphingomonas sp. YR710]